MLGDDLTLSATFTQQCTLSLVQATGGTIAQTSGTATGNCGRSVTVTATSSSGYAFTAWSTGGNANPYTFVLNGNVALSATFTAQCTLALQQSAGGTIAQTGGSASGDCGRSVGVTATAASGYVFTSWSIGGSGNPYSFNLTTSLTLSAVFTPQCALALVQTTGGAIALTSGTMDGTAAAA